LGGAAGARRPRRQDAAGQQAHPATHPEATWGAVFLGDSSSRSRPHAAGNTYVSGCGPYPGALTLASDGSILKLRVTLPGA